MPEKYNADELEPPAWLDFDFFTNVLQQSEQNKSIELKNFKITPASLAGDHFASVMFRGLVEYLQNDKLKTKSIIIKTMPEGDNKKADILKDSKIFETEISIYKDIIPRFENVLKAAGDNSGLAARCLYSSLDPKKIIIFEDIVPLGYDVLRDRMMSLDEIKEAYKKIAKWHAISMKMSTENPELFSNYRYGVLGENANGQANDMFLSSGIDMFIEMLGSVPELKQYETYFRKIDVKERAAIYFNEYFKKKDEHKSYVLCHGDFHMKNLMIKMKPFDIKLIDFQMCYMGPVVMDLIYSFFTMMPPSYHQHRVELIYSYYTSFVEAVKLIEYGGRVPTLREFRQQIRDHKYFEFYLIMTIMPLAYAMMFEEDLNDLLTNEDKRKKLYKNEMYTTELKSRLAFFSHLGYFDDL